MSKSHASKITRRAFVRRAGTLAGSGALAVSSSSLSRLTAGDAAPLPKRILGKTGLEVTTMTFGAAPSGIANDVSIEEAGRIANLALDLGINFVDTSPKYGKSEVALGRALGPRRKEILLANKVMADTIEDAEASLNNSFKVLKTDYFDVLYFHHLGDRKVEKARDPDGVFTWLLKQKQAGKCRFVGISGHNRPARFQPFLASGDVDVILVAANFVDRFIYGFEETVVPVAQKHHVGVVAMKVFGAPDPETGSWGTRNAKPRVGTERVELAIRYALGLPGVATLNLGVHTADQLRQNVDFVRRYRPLAPEEISQLERTGKELAGQWGPHFGPVV